MMGASYAGITPQSREKIEKILFLGKRNVKFRGGNFFGKGHVVFDISTLSQTTKTGGGLP